MNDFDEPKNPSVSEGVRILGAHGASNSGNDDDANPDCPPIWSAEGPSWSAADPNEPATASSEERTASMPAIVIDSSGTGDAPELPHWSEPATGQIPAVFGASRSDNNESTDTGPRFRSESDDWSDADFAAALSRSDNDDSIDEFRLGTPADAPIVDPVEDDAAFVAAVRARRAGTRAVVTSTPEARPRPTAGARRPNPPRRDPEIELESGDMLPGGSEGRDLSTAIATGAIFGTIALICFTMGPWTSAALAAVVLGVCAFELCGALQSKGLRPATLPVVAGCALTPLVALRGADVTATTAASGFYAIAIVGTVVTFASMLWFLFKAGPGRPIIGVATSLMVFAYIGGLGGYAGMLLQRGKEGPWLLFGTLLCVIAYDTLGYFVGSKFGNAKIAPDISPNKTVEGTLGGVLGAAIVGAVVLSNMTAFNAKAHPNSVLALAVTGFLIGVAALLGDLCESMLKRDLGVKDFGTILPGHGGFLDRFDGLLFALPVAYFVTLSLNAF